jgi:hypothetical protein
MYCHVFKSMQLFVEEAVDVSLRFATFELPSLLTTGASTPCPSHLSTPAVFPPPLPFKNPK